MRIQTLLVVPLVWLLASCDQNGALQVTGLLEWDRIELTAEASEPIVEVLAAEGENVRAGQVLLRLDARRLEAQRDEARAALDQARARLAELKRGPRTERIDEARARLRGARSEAVTAQKEFERVSRLVRDKLSPADALDTARSRRDGAVADRDAAQASLDELLAGTTLEEMNQAEAALAQAQARLQGLEVTLGRMSVTAPRAGRLDTLPFELGERPKVGAVLAVLLAGDAPYARVYLPEPLRAHVVPGSAAKVFVDGVAMPFDGRVRMVSRDPVFTPYYSLTERDRSRLSYVVEVTLDGEAAQRLPAGVPLRVEFPDSVRSE